MQPEAPMNNPNDPRFLRGPPTRPPPPQYPRPVSNQLNTPFLLDQSLPSTSENQQNPHLPSDYNNEQYILDMDRVYRGLENPVLRHGQFSKKPQEPILKVENQPESGPKEDETIVDIIEDIKETKKEPENEYRVPQSRPVLSGPPRPRPPQQYQPVPPRPQFHPAHTHNVHTHRHHPHPPHPHPQSITSQKMIDQSISRHCKIFNLDKKKPIYFSCHQCKNKTKSFIKQE